MSPVGGTTAFSALQACALNHSAISPAVQFLIARNTAQSKAIRRCLRPQLLDTRNLPLVRLPGVKNVTARWIDDLIFPEANPQKVNE
jgi:hypothetical protein